MKIGQLISPIRCKRENEQKNTIKQNLIKKQIPMNIEEKTYQKITPATEGNYLTTYREGDDIKTYEGVKAMYTPADFDASSVREITPEQHLSYQKAKEQALQEEIQA
jgi:hypothetical protein